MVEGTSGLRDGTLGVVTWVFGLLGLGTVRLVSERRFRFLKSTGRKVGKEQKINAKKKTRKSTHRSLWGLGSAMGVGGNGVAYGGVCLVDGTITSYAEHQESLGPAKRVP